MDSYFVLDKKYFLNNGGVDGIFLHSYDDEFPIMIPKDSVSLNSNIYNFVLLKDDELLNHRFEGGDYITREIEYINEKYVKFPFKSDFYVRKGSDDESCSNDSGYSDTLYDVKKCKIGEETRTYLPKEVIGNNIILYESGDRSYEEYSFPSDNTSQSVGKSIITSGLSSESANQIQKVELFNKFSGSNNSFNNKKSFLNFKYYERRFIFSLVITFLVEWLVVYLLLKKISVIGEIKLLNKKVFYSTFFASFSTLPYVWYFFPSLFVSFTFSIVIAEIFVLLVEAFIYKLYLNLSLKYAFVISLVANMVSFFFGLLTNNLFY